MFRIQKQYTEYKNFESRYIYKYIFIYIATFKVFIYRNFFHKILTNMAKILKAIFLAEVVNYCLQRDDSDLDSF